MLVRGHITRPGTLAMTHPWDLPDRHATKMEVVLSRRRLLRRIGLGTIGVVAAGAGLWWLTDDSSEDAVLRAGRYDAPAPDLYPAKLDSKFADAGRQLTDEVAAARYTNFYEFSSFKWVWRQVGSFHPVPWTLELGGMVARPRTYDIDGLVHAFPLEQRIYRHRCVEAWAMTVPWEGFPLAALLRKAEPLPGAKYVRFVSFDHARDRSQPWPYNEGLTLAEATNELAFIATGMYGHPLLKQHGAPVRLVVPWKYGFKSAKSLVRIELTDKQPATFWNTVAPHEYAFEANVDPDVPHPRWSQSTERLLGTGERIPTRKFNGYGEWVGGLYKA
jgi:sulfoxide reductase catalytic subunit YedY